MRPLLEEAKQNDEIRDEPRFVKLMLNVYYDVFRDVSGAISYGREFLRTHKKTLIEVALLDLYLENESFGKARELHTESEGPLITFNG